MLLVSIFILAVLASLWWFEPFVDVTENNDVVLWFSRRKLSKPSLKYRDFVYIWRKERLS